MIATSIAAAPCIAPAADVTVTSSRTSTLSAPADGSRIPILDPGDIVVAADDEVSVSGRRGVSTDVSTSAGGIAIRRDPDAAIDARDASATVDPITVERSLVTSRNDRPAGGTVDISGASATTRITVGADGAITDTADTRATAINLDDLAARTSVAQGVTIENAGSITAPPPLGASAIGIRHIHGGAGTALTIDNTDTISVGDGRGSALSYSAPAGATAPVTVRTARAA